MRVQDFLVELHEAAEQEREMQNNRPRAYHGSSSRRYR